MPDVYPEGWEKLILALGSFCAAVLTPVGVIYAASVNRRGREVERTVEALEAEVERCKAERVDLEEERDRYRAEAERERTSGLRWYALAIGWHGVAHNTRHLAGNRLQALGGDPLPALPHAVEDLKPGA